MTEPSGSPIPGFPGYTVDVTDDGELGVRSWRPWRNRPPGRFLAEVWHGGYGPYVHLRDPDGKMHARTAENWARSAGVGPS